MKIEALSWDSDFFGLRIGKAVVNSKDDVVLLSGYQGLRNDFDLLYIFTTPTISIGLEGFELVDNKVIYSKQVRGGRPLDCCARLFNDERPNASLYDLAIQSGVYSRFKLDNRFPVGSFERLYHRWIEQSVCGNMADAVFYVGDEDDMKGMLTLKIENEVGRIGLVAVNHGCRGNGYGTVLLDTAEYYLYTKQIQTIEVATQLDNTRACHWYEKNGFAKKSVTSIYHLWL